MVKESNEIIRSNLCQIVLKIINVVITYNELELNCDKINREGEMEVEKEVLDETQNTKVTNKE